MIREFELVSIIVVSVSQSQNGGAAGDLKQHETKLPVARSFVNQIIIGTHIETISVKLTID